MWMDAPYALLLPAQHEKCPIEPSSKLLHERLRVPKDLRDILCTYICICICIHISLSTLGVRIIIHPLLVVGCSRVKHGADPAENLTYLRVACCSRPGPYVCRGLKIFPILWSHIPNMAPYTDLLQSYLKED